MCPEEPWVFFVMDPRYTLAIQHQAQIAREASQARLAARVRAGRVRGGMANERLHGAAAIRLAHALAHAVVRL